MESTPVAVRIESATETDIETANDKERPTDSPETAVMGT